MIQILRQRYIDGRKPMLFLKNKLTVDSVPDLFLNIETIKAQIPEDQHFNLHYTLAHCSDVDKPRQFEYQNIIPFDIDGITINLIDEYVDPIINAIGSINRSDVGVVYSGRGIHILIGTTEKIRKQEFKETKHLYNVVCDRIDRMLASMSLPGHVDRGLWSANHTLRMPETMNIKTAEHGFKDDFEGMCTLEQRVINPIEGMTIATLAGVKEIKEGEDVKVKGKDLGGTYIPDSKGILRGCEFIKWCGANQEEVREDQWYHLMGILPHLEDGTKIAHEYSDKHPKYTQEECDEYIERSTAEHGPRTCQFIEGLWDGCKDCTYYKKINSPISIKTETYIRTESTGFRIIKPNTHGNPIPGKVVPEDLRMFFEKKHPYIVSENKVVHIWNDSHWIRYKDIYIEEFAQKNIFPAPNSNDVREFINLMFRTNIRATNWFETTTFKKINLSNGVLDLSGKEPVLSPHSRDNGFRYVLNYGYDKEALCPRFDGFLEEVTVKDKDLEDVLMEFAGYAFANEECVYAKALILLGEGSNGKSTLLNTFKKLAGKDAYSALTSNELKSEQHRVMLEGRLFNIAEETPSKAFVDSSMFKNIITGGEVNVKIVYKEPYFMPVRCKFMMAANELPKTMDTTKGFLRRLLLVPFNAEFSDSKGNKDIRIEEKLAAELPGILNRVIEGYKRLSINKKFTNAKVMLDEIDEYRSEIDPIRTFLREEVDVLDNKEEGLKTPANSIFNSFTQFCAGSNIKNDYNRVTFFKRLRVYIPDIRERKIRMGKKKTTNYRGIALRGEITVAAPDSGSF